MPRPTLLLSTIMIASSLRFAVVSSRLVAGARKAGFSTPSTSSLLGFKLCGGGGGGTDGADRAEPPTLPSRDVSSSAIASASNGGEGKKYVTLAEPAPGSPFHYAFPVHSLDAARDFYGDVLACEEGRSSEKWQDYSLHGHQIVCHWVGDDYRCVDYYNPVDGDEVPVPHAGLALTVEQFHALADRLRKAGVQFIIEPHLRFQGTPGEQWTMFFKDPRYVCC
jgi:extradiol dioxygenase family protein